MNSRIRSQSRSSGCRMLATSQPTRQSLAVKRCRLGSNPGWNDPRFALLFRPRRVFLRGIDHLSIDGAIIDQGLHCDRLVSVPLRIAPGPLTEDVGEGVDQPPGGLAAPVAGRLVPLLPDALEQRVRDHVLAEG